MKQKLLPLLLVLASVGAYAGLLSRGDLEFVYDDIRFVRQNLAIRDLGNLPYFFTNPATADPEAWSGIYRPLRTLDFAIDYAIVGTTEGPGAVRWFHIRNILYHALGVLLLFWIFCQWGADRWCAGLGALFFALHPVQTEAVAWITSRADVQCFVFFLSALLFHGKSRGFDRYFAAACAFLTLGLFSKEAAIVFPAVAVLTDLVFRDERKWRATLRRWPAYLLYSAIIGAYIFLWINRHHHHEGNIWEVRALVADLFPGQLFTMARGFVYYARLIVIPVDLAQDYYLREIGSLDLLTGLCAVLILALVVWSVREVFRTSSLFAFAVVWFFITIFPTSNLLVPIGIPTAERFVYLPMVGVAFFAGNYLHRVAGRGVRCGALVGLLFCCLFVLSFSRAQVWTNADALWTSTMRYGSPRAVEWLASEARMDAELLQAKERDLRDKGELAEANRLRDEAWELLTKAIDEFNRAIGLWRKVAVSRKPILKAIAQQSVCLFDLKLFDDALELSEGCVREWPDMEMGRYARSLALLGVGRVRESAAEIERTLRIRVKQDYVNAGAGIYEKLAEYYERRENKAQAFLALKRSFELVPSQEDNPAVFRSLREMEAEYRHLALGLEKAIEQDPADGDSRIALACAHSAFGNYVLAGPMFDDLMRASQLGRDPLVLGPYALYFWQWRDTKRGYERAIEIYREILAREPERADMRELIQTCEKELADLPKETL